MKKLSAIRYFEFHVFKGVPEKPESSFETDVFSSHEERYSFRSLRQTQPVDKHDEDILGYYVYDFENDIEKYVYADGHED
ncbi:hypothetical protein HMPREF1990_01882 [Porphyromonas gingivalis W4087]|uniref:hypothetical protein n=1 Tax=Porphyromonas gingivalis TaxID=837 RepID=UPI0003AD71C5|nr:hypothetical protein [Porphyromonas gingivalis]ERJ87065.1 hypothetical protein HMPREF1990_01882 [Porphyromonas gingivalis W4087]PDP63156.1 hypothetical protein CLI83_01890 [Porphyromonas gingivalis]PDP74957.1 hypothetical protein CLI79_06755 [Porphyromonas gingivalis]